MKLGKMIGQGNTANVYLWQDETVIKLFMKGYPLDAIKLEFTNAIALNKLDILTPKAHEIVYIKDRVGIIYDRIDGRSLLDKILEDKDLKLSAKQLAQLHQTILKHDVNGLRDYKSFLRSNILNLEDSVSRDLALTQLDSLSDGKALCHGDFHPGNILIQEDLAYTIDFMNTCQGPREYDIARTVFLIKYTPVPDGVSDKIVFQSMKDTLATLYLDEMKVRDLDIKDYLDVIRLARRSEVPEEVPYKGYD